MKNTLRLYYDHESDFFEMSVGASSKAIAEEIKPGVFVRRDEKTGQVKSVGVLHFTKRTEKSDIKIELPAAPIDLF